MELIRTEDYEAMSVCASREIYYVLTQNKRVNVALTTGRSPIRTYELLTHQFAQISLDHVHFYNFDEGSFGDSEPNITITELRNKVYNPWGIKDEQVEPLTVDNYQSYDQKIRDDGGLDLIVMGLGADGHFCANMPGSNCLGDLDMRVVTGEFNNLVVRFVTMGARVVMNAQRLLLIVNGKEKAEALKRMLEGPVSDDCPASILTLHPNLTIIADEAACVLLGR